MALKPGAAPSRTGAPASPNKATSTQPAEGTFAGRRPEPPPAPNNRVQLPPSQDFVFLWHPEMWDVVEVDGEPKLAPRLREFRYEPGVAGVEEVKRQRGGNPRRALATQAERGFLPVDPNVIVHAWGRDEEGYVRMYDGVRGPVHLSVWHRPYVLGGRVVVDFDEEGWNAWRASLVGTTVPAPDARTQRALQLDMAKTLRKLQTSAERNASAAAKAEQYERRLTVFQGGARRRKGAATPASTPADSEE